MRAPKTSTTVWMDVSVPIYEGMVVWPDDPPVRLEKESSLEKGDESTLTRLSMSAHTGTHVDAPAHFISGGSGVAELDLGSLIGRARVVHMPEVRVVSRADIERIAPREGERLLFKTSNSERCWETNEFVDDYVHLSLDAATALADSGVRCLGVDYLSVGAGEDNPKTHRALLGAGVCLIEGLNLSEVSPGEYDMVCLPLRMRGCDGAPARVVLRRR